MAFKIFAPLCCLLLAACASQPASNTSTGATISNTTLATTASAPTDTLKNSNPGSAQALQAAAAATKKGDYKQALKLYSEQALTTGNPKIIKQAARLALYTGDTASATRMAKLWLTQQPHNQQALQVLTLAYVLDGQTVNATDAIAEQLTYYPKTALPELLSNSRDLPGPRFNQLLAAFSTLADKFPKQATLWFSQAVTEQRRGRYKAAIHACDRALKIRPDHLPTRLLKAKLLIQQGNTDKALAQLTRIQKAHPDKPQPAIARIHLLLQQERLTEASQAIKRFTRDFPDNDSMQLALALFALQEKDSDSAINLLKRLNARGFKPDAVPLYLGQAYAMHKDWTQAIDTYLGIDGHAQLEARIRAARLLYRQQLPLRADDLFELLHSHYPKKAADLYAIQVSLKQHYQQPVAAQAILASALKAYPDNRDLLYLHAMAQQSRGDVTGAITSLRAIIAKHPNDINTLNALGYTLSNHSQNYQEAWYYIKRAYARAPENPAIQDSLGWVLYRLQRYAKAQPLLEQAYKALPNPDVAVHLVKTLRAEGEAQQAAATLKDARKRFPDDPHLKQLANTVPAL